MKNIRWPEKKQEDFPKTLSSRDHEGNVEFSSTHIVKDPEAVGYNAAISACKQAVESSQREGEEPYGVDSFEPSEYERGFEAGKSQREGGLVALDKIKLSDVIDEVIADVWGHYEDKDLIFEQIENAICAKFATKPARVPSVDEIHIVLSDHRLSQDDDGIVRIRFKEYSNYLWMLSTVLHVFITGQEGK